MIFACFWCFSNLLSIIILEDRSSLASSPFRNNGPTESPLHVIEPSNRGIELSNQRSKQSQINEKDMIASSPAIRRIIRKPSTAIPKFGMNESAKSSSYQTLGRDLAISDPISSSDNLVDMQGGRHGGDKEPSMFISSSSQEREAFFTGEPFSSRVEKGLKNADSSPLKMHIPSSPFKPGLENQLADEWQPQTEEHVENYAENRLSLSKSFDATPSRKLDRFSSSSAISPPSPPRLPDLHQFSKSLPTFQLATKSKSLPTPACSKKILESLEVKDKSEARKRRKEEQLLAKQLEHQFKQANRSRANRLSSVSEMVIQFSKSASDDLAAKCTTALEKLGVTILASSEQTEKEELAHIKLFRKHSAKYDNERNAFIPVDEFILEESSIILFITADRLFAHCESTETFEQHIFRIRQQFKHKNILYLVQGYHDAVKKIGRVRDKEMTARARRMLSENQPVSSSQPQMGSHKQKASPEALYRYLISMGIKHDLKILHCGNDEVAEWVTNLIIDVSTAPYRQNRQELNIKSGSDVRDTVAKVVSQVTYVTPPIAQGIASVYPNAYGLIRSVRKRGSGAIEGLVDERTGKKVANRAVSDAFAVLFGSHDPDEIVKR